MFKHLNSILYKSKLAVDGINDNSEFIPFMVQRWCSMHSPAVTTIVNETTNKYWSVLSEKKDWYVALNTIIPKCNYKKIEYYKKSKKDTEANKEYLQKIANTLEISTREVISYVKEHNLKLNLPKNND